MFRVGNILSLLFLFALKKLLLKVDRLEIHFIELPKVVEYNQNNKLSAWLRFINAESWEKLDKVANLNPKIKKAVDMVKVIGQNKEEREAYLAREMAIRDEISRLDERREEGLEEGIEIGIEKEKKRMVENLLALNIEEEKIMKASGLSKEDILKIKEEMNI